MTVVGIVCVNGVMYDVIVDIWAEKQSARAASKE
jgi:hypothetical protein